MSLPNATPRVAYLGNNTTGTYAWTWLIYQAADLHVAVLDPASNVTALTYGIDFTITNPLLQLGATSGGTIVLTASGFFAFNGGLLPTGWALILRRTVSFEQDTILSQQGNYDPSSVEGALDYLTMQTIQLQDQMNHVVQMPLDDYAAATQDVGTAAQRAGGYLAFGTTGNPYTTPALIAGVPANGTTDSGTPAVALSNLAENLSCMVNQTLTLASTDGATYTTSLPYGIYIGALFTAIWPLTSTVTNPVIGFFLYNPPLPVLDRYIVSQSGAALSVGELVAGTASLLFYDGASLRLMA